MNRVTDLLLVVVITVLPLALLPAIMPYRVGTQLFLCTTSPHYCLPQTGEGTWIGQTLERLVKLLLSHLNMQTTVLVNETLIT